MKKLLWGIVMILSGLKVSAQIQENSSFNAAKFVYQKLIAAIGDQQIQYPTLELRPGKSWVASYNCKQQKIYIDEEALKTCSLYGTAQDDAIAIILGHELTHFYKNHQWNNCETHFLADKADFKSRKEEEHEADVYGGFIAQMAGFREAEKITDRLFEDLYKAYKEVAGSIHYPAKEDRKQLMQEACTKVNRLRYLYESAQHANAVGFHGLAVGLLEEIKKDLHFGALYNSLGVAQLQRGISLAAWNDYYYPLAVDYQHPFRDPQDRTALLESQYQQAILSLEQAVRMAPAHTGAQLNLCCAYALGKRPAEGRTRLQKILNLPLSTLEWQQAKVIEAIFLAQDGSKEIAKKILLQVLAEPGLSPGMHKIVESNLNKLNGKPVNQSKPQIVFNDQLAGYDRFLEVPSSFQLAQEHRIFAKAYKVYYKDNTSLCTYKLENSTQKMHFTSSPSAQTSKQIRIGDSAEKVLASYKGEAFTQQLATDGYHLVFPTQGLFFQFNKHNTLIYWGIYVQI